MPSYRLIWVEIAQQQYDTLSEDVRLLVDHRLTQLLGDPTADAVYNRRSDHDGCPLTDRTIDPVNEPDSPDLRIGDTECEEALLRSVST